MVKAKKESENLPRRPESVRLTNKTVQEIQGGVQQILKSVVNLVDDRNSYFAIEQMSEERQWRLRSLKALSFCLGLPVVAVILSVPDGPDKDNSRKRIRIAF